MSKYIDNPNAQNTMKKLLILFFLGTFALQSYGQTDPMYTKYMFNSLSYNPAYAGSRDYMSITVIHRDQWLGIDGGPMSQSFTMHSPLRNNRIGIGLSVSNDIIGPTNQITADLSYAYRIKINKVYLGLGVEAGVTRWRADWNKLNIDDPVDPAFATDPQPTFWLPNFGAGLYLNSKTFYLGASVPRILSHDLRNEGISTDRFATSYRHFYAMGGFAFKFGQNVVFRPSFLIKNVGLLGEIKNDNTNLNDVKAPTEVDVDASLLFHEKVWVGVSYRTGIDKSSSDSVDFWASLLMKNGLRIGAAYDYTLSPLREPGQASYEVMLGYEFNFYKNKIVTPRYF